MQSCRCSTRALELFLRDVTGLSLRQSRYRLPPRLAARSQPRRAYETTSRFRALEPVTHTSISDDFIPFELEQGKNAGLNRKREGMELSQQDRKFDSIDEAGQHDDWHAEIEIVAPWPHETKFVDAVGPVTDASVQIQRLDAEADGLEIEAQSPGAEEELLHYATSATPEAEKDTPSVVTVVENGAARSNQVRSRMENRHERKLRRLQAGTYRQEAESRVKDSEEESNLDSALEAIDAMEGPPVVHSEAARDMTSRHHVKKGRGKDSDEAKPRRKATEKSFAKTSTENRLNAKTTLETAPQSKTQHKKEPWQTQKSSLQHKFGTTGWAPRKRLSPDTLSGIRSLHSSDPSTYTTATLSQHFKVSPEAIRRILKSKWRPNEEEEERRKQSWEKRGERKWSALAAEGVRPPAKWRAKGIRTVRDEKKVAERRKERSGGQGRRRKYEGAEESGEGRGGMSLSRRIL